MKDIQIGLKGLYFNLKFELESSFGSWRWLSFWVVAPCSLVEVYRHFRGACCKCLWNIGKLLPDCSVQQPRRQPPLYSLYLPLWEPQIFLRKMFDKNSVLCLVGRYQRIKKWRRYEHLDAMNLLSLWTFSDTSCWKFSTCAFRVLIWTEKIRRILRSPEFDFGQGARDGRKLDIWHLFQFIY
jgi:hypothetical protein